MLTVKDEARIGAKLVRLIVGNDGAGLCSLVVVEPRYVHEIEVLTKDDYDRVTVSGDSLEETIDAAYRQVFGGRGLRSKKQ